MKKSWSRPKMTAESDPDTLDLSKWLRAKTSGREEETSLDEEEGQTEYRVDNKPIEPEAKSRKGPSIFKWAIFLVLIIYMLLSYYKAPILARIGGYLIVEHPLKKADLIVCLMGEPVERGLMAAQLYRNGLSPRIFSSREELPDGYAILGGKKVHYPETRDLLSMMLYGLGVPKSAYFTDNRFVENTLEEAQVVRDVVRKKGYRSIVIVTSPIHTRRSWLTFKKVFEKDAVEIGIVPSSYTNFKLEDWWKTRKYAKEVIIEYQKLIYYTLKYL